LAVDTWTDSMNRAHVRGYSPLRSSSSGDHSTLVSGGGAGGARGNSIGYEFGSAHKGPTENFAVASALLSTQSLVRSSNSNFDTDGHFYNHLNDESYSNHRSIDRSETEQKVQIIKISDIKSLLNTLDFRKSTHP